ncbi:glycoside hydrolase family 37 protein [Protomyces lactucae-debilis]|uniref:Trehalase n=1 Tax=Protomyces lactucae-debilis TaxID=2754530 RepID=A0A1Y2EWY3_PROLT|nr:glycoside hydrolase family 37 protein [Protomyces lactucae-debilis]ORY76099.1 glycoside hydrolase family 37 protein [Protomyces lactucae-debilis]
MLLRSFAAISVATVAGTYFGTSNSTNGSTIIAPCNSPIFCQGELLKAVELARPFADSKTFVDLPTIKPVDEVLAAFANLTKPLSNNTELQTFLSENFGQAGTELVMSNRSITANATFLSTVNSSIVADFVSQVIDIWPSLTREYAPKQLCDGCVTSFLPVNRTFVVAGVGRFLEPYYWDSFWIVEGLLRSGGTYKDISKDIILNFLDFIEQYGFVPNGARAYYLNRSQPPVLTQMVRVYIEQTNDTSLLDRALPLLVREQAFWQQNNTILVNTTRGMYNLSRYSVLNNQPRPESYREDYETANNLTYFSSNGSQYPVSVNLTESQKATLYADLAAGAESGWDYSSRWIANPAAAANGNAVPLRTLNTQNIIPVDLNSILYFNEIVISDFYRTTGNMSASRAWEARAYKRQQGMYNLMYNASLGAYFDYNLTSKAQNTITITGPFNATKQVAFSAAQFYPLWAGAIPDELKYNNTALNRLYAPVRNQLAMFPGGIATTDVASGQQWDSPNVWPPLQYIIMQGALASTPSGENDTDYEELQQTALTVAQRYVDSTYCTWRSTGGSHPNLSPPIVQLNGSDPANNGTMFEKYSNAAIDAVGGGGEYEVVKGFGWSNGVLLWTADTFGQKLKMPECGNITAANII